MDENLTVFADVTGGCERILRTPVPLMYTRHNSRFLMIWCAALHCAVTCCALLHCAVSCCGHGGLLRLGGSWASSTAPHCARVLPAWLAQPVALEARYTLTLHTPRAAAPPTLCRLSLLPFTLWDTCHWATVPVTALVAFLLLGALRLLWS